jgi:hypothetical protein
MAKSWNQKRSKLQERRISEDVGGRVQAGSGSSWRAKSDVRDIGKLRIEAKFTSKDTYALKLKDLLKIREEALIGGLETWAMQIEFIGASKQKYAVLDYFTFCELNVGMNTFARGAYDVTQGKQYVMELDHLRKLAGQGGTWLLNVEFVAAQERVLNVAITAWEQFLHIYEGT